MAAIDFFCAADDRHRIIPLADLLERADQRVTVRCEPVADPTRPCMVACTRRAFREAWLAELISSGRSVVAIRLDDTPLPGYCARIINLQSWPARSADRHVGALVRWLQGPDRAPPRAGEVDAPWKGRTCAGPVQPARASRFQEISGNLTGGLTVIALAGLVGILLWLAVPDAQKREDEPGVPSRAATRSTGAASGGPMLGSGEPADGRSLAPDGQVFSGPSTAPEIATPVRVSAPRPESTHADALSHLCAAASLEAARAWAGALDWKQRLRLDHEPCVARLVARPGFAGLKTLLDLSRAPRRMHNRGG